MAIFNDGSSMNPLVSFNAIIDMDMALIHYIILDYEDKDIFDIQKISDKSYFELLSEIYKRKYKNPLLYFLKSEDQRDRFDEIYKTLMSEREADILKHAIATEIYDLLLTFVKESDIYPSIVYYTDAQREYLEDETNLMGIQRFSLDEIRSNGLTFSQYYLNTIDEFNLFKNVPSTSFYVSTAGINLNDTDENIMVDEETISRISYNESVLNLYDIYRTDLIGGNEVEDDDDEDT